MPTMSISSTSASSVVTASSVKKGRKSSVVATAPVVVPSSVAASSSSAVVPTSSSVVPVVVSSLVDLTGYTAWLTELMKTYYDAEDIPCAEFVLLKRAYEERIVLTADEVKTSLSNIIDDDIPVALIGSITKALQERAPSVVAKKSKGKAAGTEKVEKVEKTEKAAKTEKAVGTAKASGELPLNGVARFSQLVSHLLKPGAEFTGLLSREVNVVDGLKRESKIYTEIQGKPVYELLNTKVALSTLIDAIRSSLTKPAVITVAALVRWLVPEGERASLLEAYEGMNVVEAERKPKSAKRTKRADKADKTDKTEKTATAEKTEKTEKAVKVKKAAAGYALFTQRVGRELRESSSYGAREVLFQEPTEVSEVLRGRLAGLSTLGVSLPGRYNLARVLTGLREKEPKISVVQVSSVLWGLMSVADRQSMTIAEDLETLSSNFTVLSVN